VAGRPLRWLWQVSLPVDLPVEVTGMTDDVPPSEAPPVRTSNGAKRRPVAIACQGGGAHTAFSAGVLTRLLAEHRNSIDIRALSGTSGGAVCAVLAWSELVAAAKEPDPRRFNRRLDAFWRDNSLHLAEILPWALGLAGIRLAGELGLTLETSAYQAPLDGERPFLHLVEKHVPFDRLTPAHLTTEDPRLLISAADVLTGEFRVFRSHQLNHLRADRISSQVVLASAALPTIFEAVELCGGTFWDGGFSQNPPVRELVDACRRPDAPAPDGLELWIIQVNPQRRQTVPTMMNDIRDRRNELTENISFQQEVYFISTINKLLDATPDLFTPEAKERYTKVKIRVVKMDDEVAAGLDYESKLNRNPAFLRMLFEQGLKEAERFLVNLAAPNADVATALVDRNIWGQWIRASEPCL
jgi:NTE family protein